MLLRRLNEMLCSIDMPTDVNKDARDLMIFYLHAGARTSEALLPHFTWGCINANAIHFPSTKGDKTRTIPLSALVAEILDSRRSIPDGPFPFTRDIVYKRVKMVMELAEIPRASTHTLRKSAGAWYYGYQGYFCHKSIFGSFQC